MQNYVAAIIHRRLVNFAPLFYTGESSLPPSLFLRWQPNMGRGEARFLATVYEEKRRRRCIRMYPHTHMSLCCCLIPQTVLNKKALPGRDRHYLWQGVMTGGGATGALGFHSEVSHLRRQDHQSLHPTCPIHATPLSTTIFLSFDSASRSRSSFGRNERIGLYGRSLSCQTETEWGEE